MDSSDIYQHHSLARQEAPVHISDGLDIFQDSLTSSDNAMTSSVPSSPDDQQALTPPLSSSSCTSPLPSPALELSSDEEEHETLFELHEDPDRGLGLFATRKIPSGMCIISEDPIISMSRDQHEDQEAIRNAFSLLPKDDKKQYRKLFDTQKSRMSQVVSIYYSNCYSKDDSLSSSTGSPAGGNSHDGDEGGSCIGFLASRINHSCVPNVSFSYLNPSPFHPMGRMQFYAIKNIPKGKELLSNYDRDIWRTHIDRKKKLMLHYGFECSCEACCPRSGFWLKSDSRRSQMARLMGDAPRAERMYMEYKIVSDEIGSSAVVQDAMKTLETLESLMIKEGLAYKPLANVYRSLAKWAGRDIRRSDARRWNQWKQKELDICVTCFGERSDRAQEVKNQLAAVNCGM